MEEQHNNPCNFTKTKRKTGDMIEPEETGDHGGCGFSNHVSKVFKTGDNSAMKSSGEKEEISVEEELFSNHLLLRNIFKFSDFQDLKRSRQVNHLWKLEATKVLWNNFIPIAVQVKGNTVYFIDKYEDIKLQLNYHQFHTLIDQSTVFPCNNFVFPSTHEDLTTSGNLFFTVHGSLVKFLEFGGYGDLTAYDLLAFASKHLPNLEVLTFKNKICKNSGPECLYDILQLKKLHTRNFDSEIPVVFLSIVTKIASNLKNIHIAYRRYSNYHSYFSSWNNLMKLKLIHLVKNISFVLEPSSLDLYQELLKHNLNITKVDWVYVKCFTSDELPIVGDLLTKLLRQCSQTVKTLCSLFTLGEIPGVRIPIFPNVTALEVCDDHTDFDIPLRQVPLFPSITLDLALKFPKLSVFNLSYTYGGSNITYFSDIFDMPANPLSSVQVLDVSDWKEDAISTLNIKHFGELFPNLKEAKFSVILEPAFEIIWKFQLLKKLHIAMQFEDVVKSFPMLDSALTGLSYETVKDLSRRLHEGAIIGNSEVDALRVKPSIVDLKHLTQLFIKLVDECCDCICYEGDTDDDYINDVISGSIVLFSSKVNGPVIQDNDNVIISHVARKFGFEMCPQLRSNVLISFYEKSFHMPPIKLEDTDVPLSL